MKELLSQQRYAAKMTLRELARRTGIPKSTLHDIEMGMKSMTLNQAEIIAIVLGVRISDLYEIRLQVITCFPPCAKGRETYFISQSLTGNMYRFKCHFLSMKEKISVFVRCTGQIRWRH